MQLRDCSQPWFEMQISYDHTVGFCCYYAGQPYYWDFSKPLDIAAVWNSQEFVWVRKAIADNRLAGGGCQNCQWLKYGIPQFVDIPGGTSAHISDNWRRALEHYNNRTIQIDSFPIKYYFNFGVSCNIRCIMCSQEHIRRGEFDHLPAEPLLQLKPYLSKADQINVIGGEPLMIPSARTFLDGIITDPAYSDTMLSLFTNGTLLHQFIDRFRSMRRINVCVSLDSIGSTYEYIRHGAKWSQVERNIIEFLETGKRFGNDWQVSIACVVMKSSIKTLPDFVDWCIAHDTPCHFVPLAGLHPAPDEDVYNSPELLESIPEWGEKFHRAIEALKRKGWTAGRADALQQIRDELTMTYREHKARKAFENMTQVAMNRGFANDVRYKGYVTKAESLMELSYFERLEQFCNSVAEELSVAGERGTTEKMVTPASAYWNQRHVISALAPRLKALGEAVGHLSDLTHAQWAQIFSMAMEFKPDLIIELGRGKGNSTCIFTEVANLLGGREKCRVMSLCMTDDYATETIPTLLSNHLVNREWFQPLECWVDDIVVFDYKAAIGNAQRVMLFWDAHGFEIAGCVLGSILPLIADRCHLVLMHDMSDQRYLGSDNLEYSGQPIWKGNNWEGPRLVLGNINSAVEQAVSIVDFSTRNGFEPLSGDHSYHTELKSFPEKVNEMSQLLGETFFSLSAHWFCFSLNGLSSQPRFPAFTKPSTTLVEAPMELLSQIGLR